MYIFICFWFTFYSLTQKFLLNRIEFMISIPFNPMMFNIGPFAMSWHGFWSFIGILVAVYLVVRWSKRDGINTDIAYDVALWGILGGIIGARLMLFLII